MNYRRKADIDVMLQNRVDPDANLNATSARGAWMGNRGQLHGAGKMILRPFKLKVWIICLLEFRGRYRQVMSPNWYTELFLWTKPLLLQPATVRVSSAAEVTTTGLNPSG